AAGCANRGEGRPDVGLAYILVRSHRSRVRACAHLPRVREICRLYGLLSAIALAARLLFARPPARSVNSAPTLRRPSTTALALALALTAGCAGWRGDTYYAHRSPPKIARKEITFRFGDPGPGWQPVRNLKNVQVAW